MIKRVIGLVGLPGSGKTTWASNRTYQLNEAYVDDLKNIEELNPSNFSSDVDTVYFSDPHLCDDNIRVKAESKIKQFIPGVELSWKFWDNNIEDAWTNVQRRKDGRVISRHWLEHISSKYNPVGEVIKIYRE